MRVLNDFNCPHCGTKEYFADSEATTVRCECGLEANKIVTQVNAVFNAHSKNATTKAKMKWAKQREQKLRQERKANQ